MLRLVGAARRIDLSDVVVAEAERGFDMAVDGLYMIASISIVRRDMMLAEHRS